MNADEKWIRRAIQLAEKGISGASPNPLVGCVIVNNKRVVGEGYHALYGQPHAEINAMRQAGKHCLNATLYTNLEPCCHWGKTPPCADAIIRAGIRKVVASMCDPNPLVKNRGFRKLKENGIQIETGICQSEAQDLNRAFIKFITQKKPYVILKSALSLDGKIATSSGESQWISSKAARNFSHQMRSQVDGILVGAETVRKDDPELTSHGKGRNPVRIILSASGKIPSNSKILNGKSPTWIFHSSTRHPFNRSSSTSHKGNNIEWIYCKAQAGGKIDFSKILENLADRNISKLLIEGGGETAASALEAKGVDELFFFIAPILIGGKTAKTIFEGDGFQKMKEALRLSKMTTETIGRDLLVQARILNH